MLLNGTDLETHQRPVRASADPRRRATMARTASPRARVVVDGKNADRKETPEPSGTPLANPSLFLVK